MTANKMSGNEDSAVSFLHIASDAEAGNLEIDEFQKALFQALLVGWKHVEIEGKFYCPKCTKKYGRPIQLDEKPPSILSPTPRLHNCLYCGSNDLEVTIKVALTVQKEPTP